MADAPSSPPGPGGSSSQNVLSDNEEILLRSAIRRILESADLASVSAKKVREELISIQSRQSNGSSSAGGPIVPPSLDIMSHKKQVNALVKICFEEVSAQREQENAAAAALAAVSAGGHASSWNGSSSAGGAAASRSTFAAGGIALPGIGAAPPSAPPPTAASSRKPKSTTTAAAAAKKRKREDGIAAASALPPSFAAAAAASSPAASSAPSGYGDEDIEAELAQLEDDAVPRGRAAKRSKAAAVAGAKVKREPNPNNPFNRPLVLSATMAEICGSDELSRPQVVKQLWAYIKGNNLQNPSNKRQILCDAKLQTLFGKNMVDSFEMAKLIGKHIKKKEDIL
ncbi:hypothetical protein A4X09_0g3448 [Tilletia walkeri]|uniref:DM2 domain-containing protein n=1 Tax=Tilletia walkeri TaxID=117179 RepID=A0A8X7N846_9BASI|nr:hypothetical protein A4X09_0g3448 [Tilletia walkeri]